MEVITFLLAMLGYAGLAVVVSAASFEVQAQHLRRGVTVAIVLHVLLVWLVRYEGQLSQATRNGWLGFILFHTTLLMLLGSHMVVPRLATLLLSGAFAITSAGALGAVFRYDVVASYRIPVIIAALIGNGFLTRRLWLRR